MIRSAHQSALELEIVTDPGVLMQASEQRQKFLANVAWVEAHAREVYAHRGKYVCVSREQLFVADALEEVLALAAAAPHDERGSWYVRYIPKEKISRIYANQR